MSEKEEIAFREAVKKAVAEVDAPALQALFERREKGAPREPEGSVESRWARLSIKAWPVPQAIDQWGLQAPPYAQWSPEKKQKAARALQVLERAVPGFLWVDRADREKPGSSAARCAMEALIRAGVPPEDALRALGEEAFQKSAVWQLNLRAACVGDDSSEPHMMSPDRHIAALAIRAAGADAKRVYRGPPVHSGYAWLERSLERGVSAKAQIDGPIGLLVLAVSARAEPAMVERLIIHGADPMDALDQSLGVALSHGDGVMIKTIALAAFSHRQERVKLDASYRVACVKKLIRLWNCLDPSAIGGRLRWDQARYLEQVAMDQAARETCDAAARAGLFCESSLEVALSGSSSRGKALVLSALAKSEALSLLEMTSPELGSSSDFAKRAKKRAL